LTNEPADLPLDLDGLSGHSRVSELALIPAVASAGCAGLRPGTYPEASSSPLDLLDHDTREVR
jgi:hypothetical protein